VQAESDSSPPSIKYIKKAGEFGQSGVERGQTALRVTVTGD